MPRTLMDAYLASRAAGATHRAAKQSALDAAVRLATAERVSANTLDGDGLAAVAAIFPRWRAGMDVRAGEVYRHAGALVECVQGHATQADWTPDATPALWRVHRTDDGGGPVDWQAGVALTVDDQVVHDGVTYDVLQAHTTQGGWEPPAAPSLFAEA